MDSKPRLGIALCGSFCTFDRVLGCAQALGAAGYRLVPIMSENARSTDTRFGTADHFAQRLREICGREVIHTIAQAEPIGPQRMLDALIIAPCTGNTLAKLALGITDTAVTMAAKSHLRGGGPVIIGLSTNDALAGTAKNIGSLLDKKNVYFIPFEQDNSEGKPFSMVAHMELMEQTALAALEGRQLQPVVL